MCVDNIRKLLLSVYKSKTPPYSNRLANTGEPEFCGGFLLGVPERPMISFYHIWHPILAYMKPVMDWFFYYRPHAVAHIAGFEFWLLWIHAVMVWGLS